jgi:hypothetical protein
MFWRWGLALALVAGLVAVPRPAAAQEQSADCRAARQLVRQAAPRHSQSALMVPTGWALSPPPWIPGLAPYPYPWVPTGWSLLRTEERPTAAQARLRRALRQFAEHACAGTTDTVAAAQYAELVSLLGYLQNDVADALEQPAREILAASDSARVRELAAAILAAVATLRRGGQ